MQAHAPEWYVISLRPHGAHAGIADAARRHGAGVIRLSPWKLVANEDPAVHAALAQALACEATVFTSPAAARFAAAWMGALPCACPIAVGAGTLGVLQRAGLVDAQAPTRMDSEGVLALPMLQRAKRIGLVTAPGGRELIATALMARGMDLVRADVYRRTPIPIPASARRRLAQLADTSACLLASSAQALQQVLDALGTDQRLQLTALPLVASSERVADQASALGFVHHRIAEGPRPAQLLEAASRWHSQRFR
jgi:uroporphyrinogen-III synthase